MKLLTQILLMFIAIQCIAQAEVSEETTETETPVMEDMKVHMLTADGNVTIEFDSATEDIRLLSYAVSKNEGGTIYEDELGNHYVQTQKNGQWMKIDMGNVLSAPYHALGNMITPDFKTYPAKAFAHRIVLFSTLTPERLEMSGHRPLNPDNPSKTYDIAKYGVYQFDTEGRLVAIRQHFENGSITIEYTPVEVILPQPDKVMSMPDLFSN